VGAGGGVGVGTGVGVGVGAGGVGGGGGGAAEFCAVPVPGDVGLAAWSVPPPPPHPTTQSRRNMLVNKAKTLKPGLVKIRIRRGYGCFYSGYIRYKTGF
jgi:hypothetical protein